MRKSRSTVKCDAPEQKQTGRTGDPTQWKYVNKERKNEADKATGKLRFKAKWAKQIRH